MSGPRTPAWDDYFEVLSLQGEVAATQDKIAVAAKTLDDLKDHMTYLGDRLEALDRESPAEAEIERGRLCHPCLRYFTQFACGKSQGSGECDCPRCQGYCSCPPERGAP